MIMGNCGYVYIGQAKEWTLVGILSFIDHSAPQPIFILGEFLVICLWEARLHITLEKAEIRYFLSLKLVSM